MKRRFRFRRDFDLSGKRSSPSDKSLLTEGVLPSNIDTTTPGNTRIALWNEWRAMLEDLRAVGPIWSIVRNNNCVLAVQSGYPEMTFSSDQKMAGACDGERSLTYHFPAWRQAVAFDSNCCCGKMHGLEFENVLGEVFHRICLAKENDVTAFAEWIRMHQATGLELMEGIDLQDQNRHLPQSAARPPGTLQFSPHLLRTVLIMAAQREIQLIATVANAGISQIARIDVLRASEAHGWLVLSGNQRSLYVASEPTGSLFLESGTLEGETIWRLSFVGDDDHCLMRLQSGVDDRTTWNQLIRESVLQSSGIEPSF